MQTLAYGLGRDTFAKQLLSLQVASTITPDNHYIREVLQITAGKPWKAKKEGEENAPVKQWDCGSTSSRIVAGLADGIIDQ